MTEVAVVTEEVVVTPVVVVTPSSSDGIPKSSSGTVRRAEKACQPFAEAPGLISWKSSQYFQPDFFSPFINSFLEFADFYTKHLVYKRE